MPTGNTDSPRPKSQHVLNLNAQRCSSAVLSVVRLGTSPNKRGDDVISPQDSAQRPVQHMSRATSDLIRGAANITTAIAHVSCSKAASVAQ
jgi:hypothetical protein